MGQDVWQIFNDLAQDHPEIMQIAWDYRDAAEELHRIRPVYQRLYKHPICKFFFPHDPYIEGKKLLRCSCGKLVWDCDPNSIKKHLGHMQQAVKDISMYEFLKLKLGLM